MILLIDNYDSFSYNLYQMLGTIEPNVRVIRSDCFTLNDIDAMREKEALTHIIISPGPGRPADAGLCEDVIREFADKIPILGVCLGHQAICETFGGTISYAKTLMHGKTSDVTLDTDCSLFDGLPSVIQAARYHSLAVKDGTLPSQLLVSATADDGEIMAVRHQRYPLFGLQFHPESVLTPQGGRILYNFIKHGGC